MLKDGVQRDILSLHVHSTVILSKTASETNTQTPIRFS